MPQNSPTSIPGTIGRSGYLTPKDVANFLGLSLTTTYRLLHSKKGPPRLKIPGAKQMRPTYRISKDAFFIWIKQNES